MTQKERQALEAAEEARKEQVLLSCARRDSSRAAAEMQRRHLEAAVQLEGPNPGGAVHVTYEAVKEEKVLKLSSETLQKEHNNNSTNEAYAQSVPVSPRRPNSAINTSTPFTTVSTETAPTVEPLLRETCNAVASEVESRLERWKEQLYMQEREGNSSHAPPVGEPSFAPPSAAATDSNLKLLGGRQRRSGSRNGDYSESWPGIFTFPTN